VNFERRTKVIFESDYMRDLISLVDAKRKQSVHEYVSTDLNLESIGEIHLWYDTIVSLISESPPRKYVKGIIIKENDEGSVESINYKYVDRPENSLSITIFGAK